MNKNHSRPRRGAGQLLALVSTVAIVTGAAACSTGDDDGRPVVVATHSMLGDLARNVAGDEARVEVVMPTGADPHEFEPSAADTALLVEADLVVANGLGFEEGLDEALDTAADAGTPVLELGEGLDPLPFGEAGHGDEHGHEGDEHADEGEGEEHADEGEGDEHADEGEGEEHADEGDEHGDEDPHWFTDPLRMARAAGLVAEALAEVDGVDADAVGEQGRAHAAAIEAADAEVETTLDVIAADDRKLVTNHEVFGYFADRYGFEIVGTVVPGGTTLAEPSSADLATLVETIEDEGVPAVFADTSSSTDLAEVLAEETGREVAVVQLFTESLGDEGSGAQTYLELIATNAERIAGALA